MHTLVFIYALCLRSEKVLLCLRQLNVRKCTWWFERHAKSQPVILISLCCGSIRSLTTNRAPIDYPIRLCGCGEWSECSLDARHHYENTPIQIYRKFHLRKLKFVRLKNSDIFSYFCSNIDCGYSLEPPRRGGSNEYPQSMFWSEIRKLMYTPVNPSFTILKWDLRGSKLYRYVFVMWGPFSHDRAHMLIIWL